MNHKRTIFSVLAGVVMAVASTALILGPAQAGGQPTSPTSSSTTTSPPTETTTSPPPTTTTPPPPGGEGCTPGFWKNHPEEFPGGLYTPDALVSDFFDVPVGYEDVTFAEALASGGGGLDALLRQAVAALLNAASGEVDYPLDEAGIVSLVNAAIVSGDFDTAIDLLDLYNNLTAPGFCD